LPLDGLQLQNFVTIELQSIKPTTEFENISFSKEIKNQNLSGNVKKIEVFKVARNFFPWLTEA
jgi:hypothetical protein